MPLSGPRRRHFPVRKKTVHPSKRMLWQHMNRRWESRLECQNMKGSSNWREKCRLDSCCTLNVMFGRKSKKLSRVWTQVLLWCVGDDLLAFFSPVDFKSKINLRHTMATFIQFLMCVFSPDFEIEGNSLDFPVDKEKVSFLGPLRGNNGKTFSLF